MPKAVGYSYFSRTKEVKRVEIPNVKHYLLKDYVRIVAGAKEFSYMPFNGYNLFNIILVVSLI